MHEGSVRFSTSWMKRLADPSRILKTRTIAATSVHRGVHASMRPNPRAGPQLNSNPAEMNPQGQSKITSKNLFLTSAKRRQALRAVKSPLRRLERPNSCSPCHALFHQQRQQAEEACIPHSDKPDANQLWRFAIGQDDLPAPSERDTSGRQQIRSASGFPECKPETAYLVRKSVDFNTSRRKPVNTACSVLQKRHCDRLPPLLNRSFSTAAGHCQHLLSAISSLVR